MALVAAFDRRPCSRGGVQGREIKNNAFFCSKTIVIAKSTLFEDVQRIGDLGRFPEAKAMRIR